MALMVLILNVISTILSMVCLEGHKNLGAEACHRWRHADIARKNAAGNGGNAPPHHPLEIAVSSGWEKLGKWVIQRFN